MAKPTQRLKQSRWTRRLGVPISAWLVLGFALVIGAFATTSVVALRSTRHATTSLAKVQHQFEPLSRSVRDLGDGMATFDRAVLAFMRTGTDPNRQAAADAAAGLSAALNHAADVGTTEQAATVKPILARIAGRQTAGFALIELQDRRNVDAAALDQAYDDLHRRVLGAGGAGMVVGDNVLARPSLAELTRALEEARGSVSDSLAGAAPVATDETRGEAALKRVLSAHRTEFAGSPGRGWLDLMDEDVARSITLRRRVQQIDADIETERAAFIASGDALATEVHDQIENPAWRDFTSTAAEARASVASAEGSIRNGTARAVLFALLGLAVTAWAITWPVRRLTEVTRKLAAGDLTARVSSGGAAEVDELAHAFNHMATELDQAERSVRSYQAQLEQRVAERTRQLRHLADHDPLTNLPNRRQLFQRLNDMIEAAQPEGAHIAVMFLDLDNFKTVNDSLGHEFGDRVLTEIGERLREISGDIGFIARLGGDEFTLIFPYSGSTAEVEQRAAKLVEGFQRPITIDRRDIAVGVSLGVAMFPEHGRDATALLRAADAALFRAKDLGRNRLCMHDPSMLIDASNRFRIEQALRKAIEGGDFVLHYQPQVCLGTQRTTSVEALLRWQTSDTQIVAAGDFIEIAEKSGLMLDLNDWVLDTAARAVRDWRHNGWPEARVAVNVSAQQFVSGHFLAEIEALLARHELPADALELELTETMLQTGAITVETLHGLRLMGVTMSLDDFGTGFSSLTSLEQLPLSRVKLDRSVIAEVDRSPRAAAIARSIISLCRSLGLAVTAEGVERHEQLDFLADCGEVSVQGYLVGRPADGASIVDFAADSPVKIAALLRTAEITRPPHPADDPSNPIRQLRRRRT